MVWVVGDTLVTCCWWRIVGGDGALWYGWRIVMRMAQWCLAHCALGGAGAVGAWL